MCPRFLYLVDKWGWMGVEGGGGWREGGGGAGRGGGAEGYTQH
jgi:hypothetical protein